MTPKPKDQTTKLDENIVAENVRQIIEKLGVSATAEVWKQDDVYFVDITSQDSSLLIGKYGINLDSLQFILAIRLKNLTQEEEFEIFVDVDGWRKQKEDKLKRMAEKIADKVSHTHEPEPMYNLKPSERRVVHTLLTDHPSVISESEGEGAERYLVIKPK